MAPRAAGSYPFRMRLAYRALGGGAPSAADLIFLHGLFGSSQNWAGFARRLAPLARCWGLDLRNHGQSPHAPTHGLPECAEDVREWIEEHLGEAGHRRNRVVLVGHSMGGLVAMALALAHPRVVDAVALIDVAPKAYPLDHERELSALRTNISSCSTRFALEACMAPILPDETTRAFILTNAVRTDGGYRWRLNAKAIGSSTLFAEAGQLSGEFAGQALFVVAGQSDRVGSGDHERIRRLFPAARIVTIHDADHWVHASAPDELARLLADFVASADSPVRSPADSLGVSPVDSRVDSSTDEPREIRNKTSPSPSAKA